MQTRERPAWLVLCEEVYDDRKAEEELASPVCHLFTHGSEATVVRDCAERPLRGMSVRERWRGADSPECEEARVNTRQSVRVCECMSMCHGDGA